MTAEIKKLKPQKLWTIFFEICAIPHPSGHETALCDFLLEKAETAGLTARKDEFNNLLIEKPASSGKENNKTVILQNHLDMVPQKVNKLKFDFRTDSIKTFIDGEWVCADGTSLGADNGIGVAAAMAVMLDSNIEHGPLKAVFTSQEEIGLLGAQKLSKEFLSGDILLNLDAENEDTICVGCTGGTRLYSDFVIEWDEMHLGIKAYKIEISGLSGGHSGVDIDKNRGNAIKILIDLLRNLSEVINMKIAMLGGGTLDNAIPREASAIVTVSDEENDVFIKTMRKFAAESKVKNKDKPLVIRINESSDTVAKVWSRKFSDEIFAAILECPHGVIKMSRGMPGVVKISNNLAVLESSLSKLRIKTFQRSFCEDERKELSNKISGLFEKYGALSYIDGEYPGWMPNKDSKIVSLVSDIYQENGGIAIKKAIHIGLECGIIRSLNPKLDMVSFGPTIRNPHSPNERVKIASVENFYGHLLTILKRLD